MKKVDKNSNFFKSWRLIFAFVYFISFITVKTVEKINYEEYSIEKKPESSYVFSENIIPMEKNDFDIEEFVYKIMKQINGK